MVDTAQRPRMEAATGDAVRDRSGAIAGFDGEA
jgi:hypothetical protein